MLFTFQTRQFPRQLCQLDQWKCFLWSMKLCMFVKTNIARFVHVVYGFDKIKNNFSGLRQKFLTFISRLIKSSRFQNDDIKLINSTNLLLHCVLSPIYLKYTLQPRSTYPSYRLSYTNKMDRNPPITAHCHDLLNLWLICIELTWNKHQSSAVVIGSF